MPAALYTISFAATRSVVAVCSLEQHELPDAAAHAAFRTRLVGDRLVLSMSTLTQGELAIEAGELAVDEVEVADPRPVVGNPYAYQLTGLAPTDPVTPGDGKPKKVTRPGSSAEVTLTQTGTLTIKLTNPPAQQITVAAVFEGQDLVTNTLAPPADTVTFPVGALVANAYYAVVVIAQGVPTTAVMVQAI